MPIPTASRIHDAVEYYFARKLREVAQMNLQANQPPVLNLGIGSPDLAPHPSVIEALHASANQANSHGYQSYRGIQALREAFAAWYARVYGVSLNPNAEILPLMGSKEGMMHLSMAYVEAGDEVLVPNPGYPTYEAVTKIAQGTPRHYPLQPGGNWLPNLDALAKEDLSKVKLMWVNYPNMPTGAGVSTAFFHELVAFAREKGIMVAHDNPYSFILNDLPQSLLQVPGALDVAIELNSLSKSHNMAGWRMGMMAGTEAVLNEVVKFKTNMDSGMFLPLQQAAVAALALGNDWFQQNNAIYRERREVAWQIMDRLGCTYSKDAVGMFVWGRIPSQWADGMALSDHCLYQNRVFLTPGNIFGSQGNGYIRLSLCSSVGVLQQALERL